MLIAKAFIKLISKQSNLIISEVELCPRQRTFRSLSMNGAVPKRRTRVMGVSRWQDRGWGPARKTDLTGSRLISRLRSGAEHWSHRIMVEVRRGTLMSQDRGWGPARNTDLTGSRLRSGAEHWSHRITVEVRHATLQSHGCKRRRKWRTSLTTLTWQVGKKEQK